MIAELHSQAIISFLNYYYLCYDLSLSHVAAKLLLFTELAMTSIHFSAEKYKHSTNPMKSSVEFASYRYSKIASP